MQNNKFRFLLVFILGCLSSSAIFGGILYSRLIYPEKIGITSCQACKDALENVKRDDVEGVLEAVQSGRVLVRFSPEESMWISLNPGYVVYSNNNSELRKINLEDLKVGSQVAVVQVGFSRLTPDFLNANRIVMME